MTAIARVSAAGGMPGNAKQRTKLDKNASKQMPECGEDNTMIHSVITVAEAKAVEAYLTEESERDEDPYEQWYYIAVDFALGRAGIIVLDEEQHFLGYL